MVVAAGLIATACGSDSADTAESVVAPSSTSTPATASTSSDTTTTTEPRCPPEPAAGDVVPDSLRRSLEEGLVRLVASAPGSQITVSIRIDGYGEVVAHEPDLALTPASNQKLLTSYAALSTLDLFSGLTTTVGAGSMPDPSGTLTGDLVLVAGGDPTLSTRGPHSLSALADQVAASGLTTVTGRLLLDDARHEATLIPAGWPENYVPRFGGPLSVLMVDDNEARADAAFLADPNIEHARTFAGLLADRGIRIAGGVERGDGAAAPVVVASIESVPVGSIVADLLLTSDNESADLLLREVGLAASGEGTLGAGSQRVQELFADRCMELDGGFGDGSGVSRDNLRSAHELRAIIDLLLVDPLGPAVIESLPVAARSGTLSDRFGGTSAAGVLRAKTGSAIGGKAISGSTATADGRTATFSIIVNGSDAAGSTAAMDALLVRISD